MLSLYTVSPHLYQIHVVQHPNSVYFCKELCLTLVSFIGSLDCSTRWSGNTPLYTIPPAPCPITSLNPRVAFLSSLKVNRLPFLCSGGWTFTCFKQEKPDQDNTTQLHSSYCCGKPKKKLYGLIFICASFLLRNNARTLQSKFFIRHLVIGNTSFGYSQIKLSSKFGERRPFSSRDLG